jgi:hypothetical protein
LPYNPVSTEIPAAGAASFRLTSSVVAGPQTLTLNRTVLPGPNSQIRFRSRAELVENHEMRVDVSTDEGATWSPVYTQTGPEIRFDEGIFFREGVYSDKVVSLAGFEGKLIQLRFALVQIPGRSTPNCCGTIGWFIDDVVFENLEVAAAPVLSGISTEASFEFTPREAAAYLLQVRPQFAFAGTTSLGAWGPAKRLTAVPPVAAPAITTQPQNQTVTTGATATFTVAATGTAPFAFVWRRDGTVVTDGPGVTGATTATLTLTNVQPAQAGAYTVKITNDGGSVTSTPATLVVNTVPPPPPQLTLGEALDNTTLVFATTGDSPWTAQTAVSRDGVDAARSGQILDNQTSSLTTTVTGPATVSFSWKVSSEATFDFLRVAVDGVVQDEISGEVDWATKTVTVPAGNHTIAWTYSKDRSVARGQDTGWIDQVTTRAAPPPPPQLTLADALDNTTLVFGTGATAPWIAQTAVSRDGVDAARSGQILDNQASSLATVVTGPATVSFSWKVSSEATFDFLRVAVDGVVQDEISGEVDWATKTITVPAGNHTIAWTYSKDRSVARGQDAGWIDQVTRA